MRILSGDGNLWRCRGEGYLVRWVTIGVWIVMRGVGCVCASKGIGKRLVFGIGFCDLFNGMG